MTDAAWPFAIDGIVESVVATRQPDGSWNQAALGLQGRPDQGSTDPVTARTWGQTRTCRNFERTGEGVVQFLDDPVSFVEAALGIWETDQPVLDDAAADVRVEVRKIEEGRSDGTRWTEWDLQPVGTTVRRRTVPRLHRGSAAVVEMTVAASRLDVPAYDDDELRDRLDYFADVVRRCGTEQDRRALERIEAHAAWRSDDASEASDHESASPNTAGRRG